MSGFNVHIGCVKLDPLADGKRFRLIDAVSYDYGLQHFVVPAGFVTDFASIPGIGRMFLPKWGRYGWAAILHDYLYSSACPELVSRKEADRMFKTFMKVRDTPLIHTWIIYTAVRLFGWLFYRKP